MVLPLKPIVTTPNGIVIHFYIQICTMCIAHTYVYYIDHVMHCFSSFQATTASNARKTDARRPSSPPTA